MGLYYPVLAGSNGLKSAGTLQALVILANPALHSFVALSLILLPALTRRRQLGWPAMWQVARVALALFVAWSSLYALLLWFGRVPIFDLVYGGKYPAEATSVAFLCAIMIAASVTAVLGGLLRAFERPDLLFRAHFSSAVAAIVLGIPLACATGVDGALIGIVLSYLSGGVFVSLMLRRVRRQDHTSSADIASLPQSLMQ
jgi:O-antigen/teichoic acid export membrane protein